MTTRTFLKKKISQQESFILTKKARKKHEEEKYLSDSHNDNNTTETTVDIIQNESSSFKINFYSALRVMRSTFIGTIYVFCQKGINFRKWERVLL